MDNKVKTYITYFDDKQIEQYHLKEDENTVLFKGNDISYPGESLNNLNTFYCELCTMYYVWANNLKEDFLCFKQYRRPFDWDRVYKLPRSGEIITYYPVVMKINIISQFALCHGKQRAQDILNIMKDDEKTLKYFTECNALYTNNTMVIRWHDFCKMCDFVFGYLDEVDQYYHLDYDFDKYRENALALTEDFKYDYQMHWMAYIGERLVSCYIANNMKVLGCPRPANHGFFKPYNLQ